MFLAVLVFSTEGSSQLGVCVCVCKSDGCLGRWVEPDRETGSGSPPAQIMPRTCLFPALPTDMPTPVELSLPSLSLVLSLSSSR